MSERLSRAEVGRRVGLTDQAVSYHATVGHITPGPDGKYTERDVATLRSMQRVQEASSDRTANLLRIKVHAGAVKVRQTQLKFREIEAKTADRAEVIATIGHQADAITDRIHTWSQRYSADLALMLGVEPAVAGDILQELSELALAELGSIKDEGEMVLGRL
jgi:hypothetical protein